MYSRLHGVHLKVHGVLYVYCRCDRVVFGHPPSILFVYMSSSWPTFIWELLDSPQYGQTYATATTESTPTTITRASANEMILFHCSTLPFVNFFACKLSLTDKCPNIAKEG